MDIKVSVVIATRHHPEGLDRAIRSIFAQREIPQRAIQLIIADHDGFASARRLVAETRTKAKCRVSYVHAPRAGVMAARLAALHRARGTFVIFVHDDEEMPTNWLTSLLRTQAAFDADVVFGPVHGRALQVEGPQRRYLESVFSRCGPAKAKLIDQFYGAGNGLIRRMAILEALAASGDLTGKGVSPDEHLFTAMQTAGARFAWDPEGFVWRDPAPDRLSLRYTLAKAFTYGQRPTVQLAERASAHRLALLGTMVTGLGVAVFLAGLALTKRIRNSPDHAETLDRAARALGKALWWGPFRTGLSRLPV